MNVKTILHILMAAFATTVCSELLAADAPTASTLAPGGKEAPAGYTWKKAHCMHVLFPDGWFYKEQEGQGTKAFFVTKESIELEGKYKTGLSSNMITNVPDKTGIPASDYAARLFEALQKTASHREVKAATLRPDLTQISGFFRKENASTGNITVQYITTIANNKTGTLYIVQFETREAEWDSVSPIATALINNLVVDDKC